MFLILFIAFLRVNEKLKGCMSNITSVLFLRFFECPWDKLLAICEERTMFVLQIADVTFNSSRIFAVVLCNFFVKYLLVT